MNKEDKRTSGGLFYRNVNFIPGCVLEMLRNLYPRRRTRRVRVTFTERLLACRAVGEII